MTVVPGSHKWGPIAREFKDRFFSNPLVNEPVPVELPAGSCMFHHSLNFHRTGANSTPNRRRGLALHYIRAETMYLGIENEEARLLTECEKPRGEFRFMLIRGKEFPGRV
jgi:ectoine hydroxylase-related dioxygenase (phytanoyl-CoA dioxygenase family)